MLYICRNSKIFFWPHFIQKECCWCKNRRISGRESRTVRLRQMVTGGRGHDVYPGSGSLDGGNTLRPTWLILMIWVLQELIYHKIIEAKTLEASLWYDCCIYLPTSLALVYIMHQRSRITRVLAKYGGGGGVLVLITKSCGIFLVCGSCPNWPMSIQPWGSSAQSN